jgi:hypothetical protein
MEITTTYTFKGLTNASKEDIQKFISELQDIIGDTKLDILTAKIAYEYCYNGNKKRWIEAEPIIMKDPEYAYLYAKSIIKGRWAEAESVIMKNADCAYCYAMYVIKERWLDAEPYIKTNSNTWAGYRSHFKI